MIGQRFDTSDLVGRQGCVVIEVEAEPLIVDERSGLLDVLAQDLTQGPVQDVRPGVMPANGGPTSSIDGRMDQLPH